MAPVRKSKSVNKRYANEASPVKDASNSSKSKQKRKISDKLGPQWSKVELERFYEAYRIYGKDWKKVAALVRNRSVEMVEALYNMNRAYLSLPEGTASVVGLIAMMTDHYNVLQEGSDSERESNDASSIPQKPQKRKRVKVQHSTSKEEVVQPWPKASSEGCLSLLKRARTDASQPRVVKKRTPRVPVSYSYKKENGDNSTAPNRRGRRLDIDANDEEVAHGAALALAEASQRGGSPRVSQSPYKRTEHGKASSIQSWERMIPQAEAARTKLHDVTVREDCLDGRLENRRRANGMHARDSKSLVNMEGVGTVEVHRRGKKFYRKQMKVEDSANCLSDDGGEACSGTEERPSSTKGKTAAQNAKREQFSPRGQRKKSKKLFSGDENTALDALQTLADLSLMFPDSTMESESSVQLKEDRTATLDMDEKSIAPEATSTSHHREKNNLLRTKEKTPEHLTPRKSKLRRNSVNDVQPVNGVKEQPQIPDTTGKRKRKSTIAKKSLTAEAPAESLKKSESIAGEEGIYSFEGKHTGQVSSQSRQWKLDRVSEGSSVNSDQKRAQIVSAASPAEASPPSDQVNLPSRRRSRRKQDPKRTLSPKEVKSLENMTKNQPIISQQDRFHAMKEKLSCCLSSDIVRRWCTFEWFYSAIDYPWFANKEFVEYLNHVGLGHIPRLTRVEWGVIRSSLGKPRRLSERFLHDEREKLKQYRESVRKHYAELRNGVREGLPRDLPRPLSVGQRVIAIHPRTRELHDGSVLTVDHDKCRVQFDRPELGVEFVMDVDCMPASPLDNMPEALRRQLISAGMLPTMSKEPQMNGHSNFGAPLIFSSGGNVDKAPTPMVTTAKQSKGAANSAFHQAKSAGTDIGTSLAAYGQPCTAADIQAREADIRALSELTRALDKKEALLMELGNTNNDVLESQNGVEGSLKDSEPIKKHMATVLVQLKEANGQASSALHQVRQRNAYPESSLPPWLRATANPSLPCGLTKSDNLSFISKESGSAVVEIVKGSRLKANTMVDAAIKAMSSTKEGEDIFVKIGEALDHVDKRQSTTDTRVSTVRSLEQVNGNLGHHHQLIAGTSGPLLNSDATSGNDQDGSDKNKAQFPSDLITSCVATLLMIQTCTERQYPPADVAQIIDSAISSLHPCCPQNLPIYREIEMCMGRIKTQILALIPT